MYRDGSPHTRGDGPTWVLGLSNMGQVLPTRVGMRFGLVPPLALSGSHPVADHELQAVLLFSRCGDAERGHRCAASAPSGGPYDRRDFARGRPRGTPSQPDSGGKERFGQHHCHRAAKLKNLTRNPPFFETSPPPRAVIAFQPIPRAFLTLMTRNENLRDDRNP